MANPNLTKKNFNREIYGFSNINNSIHTAEVRNEFVVVPQTVSNLRDVTPGDGSVSFGNGEYTVSTTATGTDTQALETSRIGQYKPGLVAECGIYVRKSSDPVGIAEWGYGRDSGDDEIFWRLNSDGSYECVIKSGGTEAVISESDWDDNVSGKSVNDASGNSAGVIYGWDAMDGSGDSGINLSPSDGYIYKVKFSWYGGGGITFTVVGDGRTGHMREWPIVSFFPKGRLSMQQPNQPVFARLDNDGTATADDLNVAGRQFAVFGGPVRRHREVEHFNNGDTIGTSDTVVALFRRKSGFEGVKIDIQDIQISTDQQLHGYTLIDPDLSTNASWSTPTNHSSGEVATEVDTSTSVNTSTGTKYGGFLSGTGKNEEALSNREEFNFPVIRQNPVAVILKSVSGSSATVDTSLTFEEEW